MSTSTQGTQADREALAKAEGVLASRADGASATANRVYLATNGKFVVLFEYDPYLVSEVKKIPGRRFVRESKCWTIPPSIDAAKALLDFMLENDFDFNALVVEHLEKIISEHEEQKAASRAADADIEVEGLGGTLRPFQKAGVAYAIKAKRTFIADQMGLGKTCQALATIHAAGAYPALVICPASLKINWRREAEKWLPDKAVSVLDGKSDDYDADIVVVNYDILKKHFEPLKALGFKAVVLDESHYVKSHKTQRAKLCKELAKGVEIRLLLSGTPLVNRPQELISQLEVLDRLDGFGGFWPFATRYCEAHRTRFGLDLSGAAHLNELNDKLRGQCYLRRTKDQVLTELPAKQRAVLPVNITNRGEYERAEEELIEYVGEVAANDEKRIAAAVEEWVARNGRPPGQGELRNIRADVRMTAEANAERAEQLVRIEALKQLAARGKMDAVCEWVEDFIDSGEKLVMFAHHREIVNEIAERFSAPSITGDTPSETRQDAVDRFQNDPSTRLIVLNIRAGGVGLTLTAASDVAFCELDWTPAAHDQGEDRCHRIGQNDSVTAWYLLAEDTVDDEIHDLIERKRKVVDEATEGGETMAAGESIMGDLVERLQAKAVSRERQDT